MSVARKRHARARRARKQKVRGTPATTPASPSAQSPPLLSDVRPPQRALTEEELFKVPAPAWEIEGRIEQGGFNVVIGPRGSYKTFLVASLLLALTVKRATWFGSEANRIGPVTVVPLEDLRGWRQRWEAARRAEGIADDERLPIYTWPHSVNFYTGHGVDALQAEVERLSILHVVVDPWADAISGSDENAMKDVGLSLSRLKQLRRDGRSVTVVCHTGHDESRERGSTVLGAAADTMMLMKREDGNGAVLVECTKMRNGERFAPLRLEFDKAALVLRPVGVSVRQLPKQQAVVLEALRTLGPAEIGDWRKRCEAVEGVPRRTFFAAKAALMKAGRVEELDGGLFLA